MRHKTSTSFFLLGRLLIVASIIFSTCSLANAQNKLLNVVTTLPDYASIAKEIGGPFVKVNSIVLGNQDAHFIRPKPSFVTQVARANVVIATGLDLELWLPTVIDRSGNRHVRSGQPGFVSAAEGMKLMDVPKVYSRIEGGLHIYGNPHVTCSPLNMRVAATNIASGLMKNMPEQKEFFQVNLSKFHRRLDEALFGSKLVDMLGGQVLCQLAEEDKLVPFLEKKKYQGRALIEDLGGWLKKMAPLRGKPIVTYHENWIYFLSLFGLELAGTVEPKPGIPPSPRHRAQLIDMMQKRGIKLLLSANYFNTRLAKSVANRVGAQAVIVPLYVGGDKGIDDYFALVELWMDKLLQAARQKGTINE